MGGIHRENARVLERKFFCCCWGSKPRSELNHIAAVSVVLKVATRGQPFLGAGRIAVRGICTVLR